MSHPPRNKKIKVEDDPKEDEQEETAFIKSYEQLEQIQDSIEEVNNKFADEVFEIEKKYNKQRRPLYNQRSEIIKTIPQFWLKAFMNHYTLSELIDQKDAQVLEYLENIDVIESEDIKSGYSIIFKFTQNPYFENKELKKDFEFSSEGTKVTATPIKWKPGKDITKTPLEDVDKEGKKRLREQDTDSFFCWFSPDDQDIEIAEIIREQIWPEPARFYHGTDILEGSEDDEDEGDGEEEEEEENPEEEDLGSEDSE